MDFDTPYLEMAYVAYSMAVCVWIPIVILMFAYYKIFSTIKEHNHEMSCKRQGTTLPFNVEEVKITKALFAAVLGFILCWGPIAIIDMVDSFSAHKFAIPRQVFMLYVYLGFGSCSINPIIYGVMNRAFRAEFSRILSFWRTKIRVTPLGLSFTLQIRNLDQGQTCHEKTNIDP